MPHVSEKSTRPCWISLPGSKVLRQCRLLEISERAATLESSTTLPDSFYFFSDLDSRPGRRCDIISRSGQKVRVKFSAEGETPKARRPTLIVA